MKEESWLRKKIDSYKEDFAKTFLNGHPRKVLTNILLVVFGNIILSFATVFFLLPGKIVMGGNSGIALILMEIILRSTRGNYPSWIDADFLILLLTVFFFILAFILLGFSSAIKNTISAIVYPSFVFIFNAIRTIPDFHFLRIEEYMSSSSFIIPGTGYDPATVTLIAGIFGGIFMGLATSLAFKGGGSCGGTTCLVVFFSKHTVLKASTVSIIIDSLIIGAGVFVYMNAISALIGILTAIVCATIIGKIFVGGSQALHAEIISSHWEAISHAIHKELERGTTIYTAKGGYTGEEKKVVYVSFSREEYHHFLEIIQKEDPSAFVTITTIYDVSGGYGFSQKVLLTHKHKDDKKKDD